MNFKSVRFKRERTFNLFSKIEDHANDIHDYLKYIKFGYGRATDHTSKDIRAGLMTRNEAIKLVNHHDSINDYDIDDISWIEEYKHHPTLKMKMSA